MNISKGNFAGRKHGCRGQSVISVMSANQLWLAMKWCLESVAAEVNVESPMRAEKWQNASIATTSI